MRPQDFSEIGCLWKQYDNRALGIVCVDNAVAGMAWSVWCDGQPVAAYGFSHAAAFDPDHWQAWAFGTTKFKRCVPIITRHIESIKDIIEAECRRLQVITSLDHDVSHRWLEGLGAEFEGVLRSYGRNGEDFAVYSWVRK